MGSVGASGRRKWAAGPRALRLPPFAFPPITRHVITREEARSPPRTLSGPGWHGQAREAGAAMLTDRGPCSW